MTHYRDNEILWCVRIEGQRLVISIENCEIFRKKLLKFYRNLFHGYLLKEIDNCQNRLFRPLFDRLIITD